MKIIVLTSYLLTLALAEPPVEDSYAAAAHDHGLGYQESISEDYNAPRGFGSSRTSISQEYEVPSAKLGQTNQEYGVPNTKLVETNQKYDAPRLFARSQDYKLTNSRSGISSQYRAPSLLNNGISQGYTAPKARTSVVTQKYGVPNVRSLGLSQKYAKLGLGKSISDEYSVPELDYHSASEENTFASLRDNLSQEYGAPNFKAGYHYNTPSFRNSPSESYRSPLQNSSPSSKNGLPELRLANLKEYNTEDNYDISQEYSSSLKSQVPSEKYGAPGLRSHKFLSSTPSQKYGTPSSRFNSIANSFKPRSFSQSYSPPQSYSNSPSSQYGTPNSRSYDSYSQNGESPSQSYGTPARSLADSYAVPNARGVSQGYTVPSSSENLKTSALASPFARSSAPSQKYGEPSLRNRMPSDRYGLPEQYAELSNQGYSYARRALDELLNQDPAHYDFAYKVNDYESGSDFGHTETRQENKAEGSYFVVLPDGTKQVVEYEADEQGFKPRISVEPADTDAGYDSNASDLASTGPY